MQAVIIAAGESSRFWPLNKDHKSTFQIMGKPLIYWTAKGIAENDIKEIIVVCSKDSQIPSQLGNGSDIGATIFYVYQETPLGTGNALWQAKDLVRGSFFVVWPSKVNTKEIIAEMRLRIDQEDSECILLGAEDMNRKYGMLRMEGNIVQEIIEEPSPGKEPSNITTLGTYFFKEDFFAYYAKISRHHEKDFIDAINLYIRDKKASLVLVKERIPSLKYPWHTFGLMDILFGSSYFSSFTASSATIEQNVVLHGNVYIGENTIIHAGTTIEGPCFIGDNCEIGYSNIIRGPVNLEQGVKTGAFCEISSSIIQRETHLHSGYVGNSVIGEDCRFGAGFIVANRRLDRGSILSVVKGEQIDSGLTRFGVIVGNRTRFGIHTGTMPGVLVGSECAVFPGTLVFENLPDHTTFSTKYSTSSKR